VKVHSTAPHTRENPAAHHWPREPSCSALAPIGADPPSRSHDATASRGRARRAALVVDHLSALIAA
jgi:hypothetical protein